MEHDAEPVPGLPSALPAGEQVVWQGAPDWRHLAVHVFHVRPVAAYLALLVLWNAIGPLYDGAGIAAAARAALWPFAAAATAVGLVLLYAWGTARTTLYTITTKRLVIRSGMAVSITVNLPFRVIGSAGLVTHADGSGDILVEVAPAYRAAYLMLWPNVRFRNPLRPKPMLRGLAEPRRAGEALATALTGQGLAPAPAEARPDRTPPLVPAAT